MALFPTTQGPVSNLSRSRKGPETMTGYPTADSVRAKEPKAPGNYPPPPRSGVRKTPAPPSGAIEGDDAPRPPPLSRRGVTIEDESEFEMSNNPNQFRYAPAPKFNDGDRTQPLRGRNSKAPVDMGGGEEGREEGTGQDGNDEQGARQTHKSGPVSYQQGQNVAPPGLGNVSTQRSSSVHARRQPPPEDDDPFTQDHDMEEAQPQTGNQPQRLSRSRAPSVARGGAGFGSSTRTPHPENTREHEMGDPGNLNHQPTRSRAQSIARTGPGLGDPARSNPIQQDHRVTSAPHRVRGLRQEDSRQSHSVPSNRRIAEDYEETDRDEVIENPNPNPQSRGRSRAPISRNLESFQSAGPPPQQLGRGRSVLPTRDQVPNISHPQDHHRNEREAESHRRPDPQDVFRAQQRAPQPPQGSIPQAPPARIGYRGSALPPSFRDDGKTLTRSRSVEPAKGIHDILVNQIVSAVSEENAVLKERLANYQTKCDQVEKLEARVENYQTKLEASDEQYKHLEKAYNDELVDSKRKLSLCVVKMNTVSYASEVVMNETEARMDLLRSLNAGYAEQVVAMKSDITGLNNIINQHKDQQKKWQEAIETARNYTKLYTTLDQELMDAEVEKHQAEVSEMKEAKDKVVEDKQKVVESAEKAAGLCWSALSGKLSDEKVDSLKLNKASPLIEVISLLNDVHIKQAEEATALATIKATLSTTQIELATARVDLKAQKAAYNAGGEAVVALCKTLNIEPPARNTPSFVEVALAAARPILHEKLKNLSELITRLDKMVPEKMELTKQLAEAKAAITLAEAQRDDLQQKFGATEDELKASAERAKSVTALQKELVELREREKKLKEGWNQVKESENSLRTQLMTAKGQGDQAVKAKEAELQAAEKVHAEHAEQEAKKMQELVNEIAKIKEVAKEKINGVGVSNAAAAADELARVKRELEVEKAKHEEAKVLERFSTGKCTPAEKALVEHIKSQNKDDDPVEADKIAESKYQERYLKAQRDAQRDAKKWEDRYHDLEAKVAEQEPAKSQVSKSRSGQSVAARAEPNETTESLGLTAGDLNAAASISYLDAGTDDEGEPPKSQAPTTSKSALAAAAATKKKTDREQEKMNTEYRKASDHPDVAKAQDKTKKRERALTEAPSESVSSPKKARFSTLPSSEVSPPPDESLNDLFTPLSKNAEHDDGPEVETQAQAQTKNKSSGSTSTASGTASQKRTKSKQIDVDSDEEMDQTLGEAPATQSRASQSKSQAQVKKPSTMKRSNAVNGRKR